MNIPFITIKIRIISKNVEKPTKQYQYFKDEAQNKNRNMYRMI